VQAWRPDQAAEVAGAALAGQPLEALLALGYGDGHAADVAGGAFPRDLHASAGVLKTDLGARRAWVEAVRAVKKDSCEFVSEFYCRCCSA
jgi:hypothetical protein